MPHSANPAPQRRSPTHSRLWPPSTACDWTKLKSEVERRAAEAPAAPGGLVDALARAFGLGSVTGTPSPVSYTPMGRSWSITTNRGRWLAGTVYDWIDEA